ncbi:hypothetical protein C9374_000673 [Naegleria lovaniensis]|uniref:Uncharacterized protein n=1 Tax=Naegleria lovaniensis TaxID=51637 RepID=A0AA88KNX5_NAELO|nr:uncharacterized protein C9374_000673 [Naegleria lovaniensis]KAG2388509.1 hypothetical protein C9374_000673 [Naegleria lovaniensis]
MLKRTKQQQQDEDEHSNNSSTKKIKGTEDDHSTFNQHGMYLSWLDPLITHHILSFLENDPMTQFNFCIINQHVFHMTFHDDQLLHCVSFLKFAKQYFQDQDAQFASNFLYRLEGAMRNFEICHLPINKKMGLVFGNADDAWSYAEYDFESDLESLTEEQRRFFKQGHIELVNFHVARGHSVFYVSADFKLKKKNTANDYFQISLSGFEMMGGRTYENTHVFRLDLENGEMLVRRAFNTSEDELNGIICDWKNIHRVMEECEIGTSLNNNFKELFDLMVTACGASNPKHAQFSWLLDEDKARSISEDEDPCEMDEMVCSWHCNYLEDEPCKANELLEKFFKQHSMFPMENKINQNSLPLHLLLALHKRVLRMCCVNCDDRDGRNEDDEQPQELAFKQQVMDRIIRASELGVQDFIMNEYSNFSTDRISCTFSKKNTTGSFSLYYNGKLAPNYADSTYKHVSIYMVDHDDTMSNPLPIGYSNYPSEDEDKEEASAHWKLFPATIEKVKTWLGLSDHEFNSKSNFHVISLVSCMMDHAKQSKKNNVLVEMYDFYIGSLEVVVTTPWHGSSNIDSILEQQLEHDEKDDFELQVC